MTKKFLFTANAVFEADDIDDALTKLAYHFLNKSVGDGESDLFESGETDIKELRKVKPTLEGMWEKWLTEAAVKAGISTEQLKAELTSGQTELLITAVVDLDWEEKNRHA